ncbi:MAG: Rieske 2Fe-2S domain-containing protein [Burkholderiaceae bacterium]|jgi:nitrite reductase/ring-hydroxylating ferredoxin subunit|nr:Rieske 2Fe-2S domain-containing protein [Burkholderiaceae bacterium]
MPETLAQTQAGIELCGSEALAERGPAVAFEVVHDGQPLRAFAVRYQGRVVAYLNRCTHIAMEMDYRPNQFFDHTGQWLMCATHGALYRPGDGRCAGGPGCGALTPVAVSERAGIVYWHPSARTRPAR